MPRGNFSDGQEIVQGDLIAINSRTEMELYDRILYELMNRQQSLVFGDSFSVSYINATTLQVKLGNGIQLDNTQVDPEPLNRPLYLAANTNVAVTAADPTNNRIDIVCIKANRASAQPATRNFKDADTGAVSPQTFYMETDWRADLLVTAGNPGVSPSVPATPSGYIKLAEVLVTASTGVSGGSAITDKRPRYKKSNGWANVVSKSANYTADVDDDIIFCDASGGAFTVTLPPASTLAGKKYSIIKTDSSANAVSVKGNSSELISDNNIQQVTSQYSTLNIAGNGTQTYLT